MLVETSGPATVMSAESGSISMECVLVRKVSNYLTCIHFPNNSNYSSHLLLPHLEQSYHRICKSNNNIVRDKKFPIIDCEHFSQFRS